MTVPGPSRIALGVVTYNNPRSQLAVLVGSIERSASRLDGTRHCVVMYTVDCGNAVEWPSLEIPFRQLPHTGNLGFGGGMNRLMSAAFSDPEIEWFLCINPDGRFHPNLLRELLDRSEVYPNSLVEARQFPEEHPKPYEPYNGKTSWASGACVLIPRRVYEAVGGFDENIFMYMEDVDFSWRVRVAGFEIRVAANALFGHSVLNRRQSDTIERFYYTSGRYLAHKWGDANYRAANEAVLESRGWLADLPPLSPSAGGVDVPTPPATFEYGAAFAPVRWLAHIEPDLPTDFDGEQDDQPGHRSFKIFTSDSESALCDFSLNLDLDLPARRVLRDRCRVTDCIAEPSNAGPDRLAVVVLFDYPFDFRVLDEALFSLAIQDYEALEVVLVHPTFGPRQHERFVSLAASMPWPELASVRVVEVQTRASRTAQADLLNAGIIHARGRYLAFLPHLNLVYQHAYPMLIGHLIATDAAVVFGGVRTSRHQGTLDHWMVTEKGNVADTNLRSATALADVPHLHAFVADRRRCPDVLLYVDHPGVEVSVRLFLLRLGLHPLADHRLASRRAVESRVPPNYVVGIATSLSQLLGDGREVRLNPLAFPPETLLGELASARPSKLSH